NLDKVLAEYGVSEVPGMVFENDQTMYYQYQAYLLPEIGSSVYTSSVTNMRVFAPYSKAVSYSDTVEGVDFTALLTTSTMSVAKADYANASTSEFEEGDVQGPFQVGLAAVKTSGAATAEASAEPASSAEPSADDAADDAAGDSAASVTSTLVVYGSELMFTDEADQMVSSANSSMFSDTISALTAGGASGNLVIPVKEYGVSQVTIPALNALLCGLAIMAVVPLGCLAAGVAIWYRRRKS
ncbi:MAG: hypothetical protein LBQ92_00065, partial [Propionibacteriaceae bacterium]|nr:hypothetical protein [Propionibacteriaceae bacterium]